jgi:hypothetical protein
MLTISICLTKSEHVQLDIISSFSMKTVELLEYNIRNEYARANLKKSINLYCKYAFKKASQLFEKQDSLKEDQVNEWKELLYRIVISIIKILRCDFESNNVIEIELVIYFYELLIVGFFVIYFFYLKFKSSCCLN